MAAELPTDAALVNGLSAARPPLIRAMNEQLLLEHIRAADRPLTSAASVGNSAVTTPPQGGSRFSERA